MPSKHWLSVHGFWSLHCWLPLQLLPQLGTALFWQAPESALQLSIVQTLLSSQASGVPTHLPVLHASPEVHGKPSEHKAPSAMPFHWHKPVAGLQASVVHALPSAQLTAFPAKQLPALQVSPLVQPLPSLQA